MVCADMVGGCGVVSARMGGHCGVVWAGLGGHCGVVRSESGGHGGVVVASLDDPIPVLSNFPRNGQLGLGILCGE